MRQVSFVNLDGLYTVFSPLAGGVGEGVYDRAEQAYA